MLTLNRRISERVIIDDTTIVTLLYAQRGTARLQIETPADTGIRSLRIGESTHLGNGVRLCVLGMQGQQVKLGFDAPREIPIYREELYRQRQNQTESDQRLAPHSRSGSRAAP